MRIAHVTSIHPDFDKRVWRYCRTLAALGVETHLVSPWAVSDGALYEGVRFHTFKRVSRRLMRPILIPLRILRHLIRLRNKVDLYHFHDLDLLPIMAIFSLFLPVVYDVHENYPDEMIDREYIPKILRRPLYWFVICIEYICSKVIGNVIVVCSSQEERFGKMGVRILPIMNYASIKLIDQARTDDYAQRDNVIVYTGGHYESNGSLLLLEIASQLRQFRPQVRVIVIDCFPIREFREIFMSRARSLGVLDLLDFQAPVAPHEIMTVLNRATIGISPNLRNVKQEKAVPTKLFEYMAAGLPLIASDLPYAREISADGEFELLAQPEDVGSFVRALIQLVDDRGLAQHMGASAQQNFTAKYNWEAQMPHLMHYYNSILCPSIFLEKPA